MDKGEGSYDNQYVPMEDGTGKLMGSVASGKRLPTFLNFILLI